MNISEGEIEVTEEGLKLSLGGSYCYLWTHSVPYILNKNKFESKILENYSWECFSKIDVRFDCSRITFIPKNNFSGAIARIGLIYLSSVLILLVLVFIFTRNTSSFYIDNKISMFLLLTRNIQTCSRKIDKISNYFGRASDIYSAPLHVATVTVIKADVLRCIHEFLPPFDRAERS